MTLNALIALIAGMLFLLLIISSLDAVVVLLAEHSGVMVGGHAVPHSPEPPPPLYCPDPHLPQICHMLSTFPLPVVWTDNRCWPAHPHPPHRKSIAVGFVIKQISKQRRRSVVFFVMSHQVWAHTKGPPVKLAGEHQCGQQHGTVCVCAGCFRECVNKV